jgi:hypothetical protein
LSNRISQMEIFRLRPNRLTTPNGGGFYVNRKHHMRNRGRPQPIHTNILSQPSTTLLLPGLYDTHRDVASPKLDDISIHSADIDALLYGESESDFDIHRRERSPPHRRARVRISPPGSDVKARRTIRQEKVIPPLSSSFSLPEIGGYTLDPSPREPMVDAETQTAIRIHLREHLPGIKDHKIWRMECMDPFIEELKSELLKNKPANVEEFVIAICEARLTGKPLPVTHKGHQGEEAKKIITNKSGTIKLQALPELSPQRASPQAHKRTALGRPYYRENEKVGALLVPEEIVTGTDDFNDSRPVTALT